MDPGIPQIEDSIDDNYQQNVDHKCVNGESQSTESILNKSTQVDTMNGILSVLTGK